MINNRESATPIESVSRMLGWGRILLVGGGVVLAVAIGTQLSGPTRVGATLTTAFLWCGGVATVAGAILTALGALEQRLIETRAVLLAAIEQVKADKIDAPAEPSFRSRPAAGPWRRASARP